MNNTTQTATNNACSLAVMTVRTLHEAGLTSLECITHARGTACLVPHPTDDFSFINAVNRALETVMNELFPTN